MRVNINVLMGFKCESAQMIDEVHTLIGAGAAEGAIDAANILKPALARGELQCIGATTLDEYRKHIEKDPALERRFQPVKMSPLSLEHPVLLLCPTIRQCLESKLSRVCRDRELPQRPASADSSCSASGPNFSCTRPT